MSGWSAGFFGKIPARGDFVRHDLPREAVAALDDWLQRVLPASRERLGPRWSDAWLEAPIWRFHLRPGICGPLATVGTWLPSTDRAGRLFPLIVLLTGPSLDCSGPVLDAAETVALGAIERDVPPDRIAAALAQAAATAQPGPLGAAPGEWWTDGSPRVAPSRRIHAGLPDEAAFIAMLTDADDDRAVISR